MPSDENQVHHEAIEPQAPSSVVNWGALRVIVESPYRGDTPDDLAFNLKYLRACIRDSLDRGEAPFASHRMYTEALDDNIPDERRWGIEAGQSWMSVANLVAVYTDLGISNGMKYGIEKASELGIRIEFRELPDTNWQGAF